MKILDYLDNNKNFTLNTVMKTDNFKIYSHFIDKKTSIEIACSNLKEGILVDLILNKNYDVAIDTTTSSNVYECSSDIYKDEYNTEEFLINLYNRAKDKLELRRKMTEEATKIFPESFNQFI